MKFPSILRVPRHRRFNIQPRYYDPIKEDIENRTARIKREMELRNSDEEGTGESTYQSRISGSFSRNAQYGESRSSRLRFIILVALVGVTVGYIFLGNLALYVAGGVAMGAYLMKRLSASNPN